MPIPLLILVGLVVFCLATGRPLLAARFRTDVIEDPMRGHTLTEFKAEMKRFLMDYHVRREKADPGWLRPETVCKCVEEYHREFGT